MAAKHSLNDDSVIVIIGSGAGGGTLANELCQKGHKVVCLEAGGHITREDFVNDEFAMYGKITWLDKRTGQPTWMVKAVGGTTVHWAGNSLRFKEHEMKARTHYGDVDGAGVIDWPLTLQELEPYYDKAEAKLAVTGTNGHPLQPDSNPVKIFKLGARRVGYKKVTTGPSAINSRPHDGRPACQMIGFCTSGCKIGAKWSTLYTEVPKAQATGKYELRTRCMAQQIQHDHNGKATGVLYVDGEGKQHVQKARVVCVAGNAVETPRLLLNSASSMFPDGMANADGNVGRYYTRHATAHVFGTFEHPVNAHRSIQACSIVSDEARHDPSRGFAAGYHLEVFNVGLPLTAGGVKPGEWGRDVSRLIEQYDHMMGIWVCGEDLPQPSARITLNPSEKDQYGLPIPDVAKVDDHPNDMRLVNHAKKSIRSIYEAAGAKEVWDRPPFPNPHNMSSCRMSADPRDGVCNKWGQTHQVKNLYISDGCQLSTSGAPNPTLTIVALAIRQADHLHEQLGKGVL